MGLPLFKQQYSIERFTIYPDWLLFTEPEFLAEPIPYLGVPVHINLDFGKVPTCNVQVCSFAPPISGNNKSRQELAMRYGRTCASVGCKVIGSTVRQSIVQCLLGRIQKRHPSPNTDLRHNTPHRTPPALSPQVVMVSHPQEHRPCTCCRKRRWPGTADWGSTRVLP